MRERLSFISHITCTYKEVVAGPNECISENQTQYFPFIVKACKDGGYIQVSSEKSPLKLLFTISSFPTQTNAIVHIITRPPENIYNQRLLSEEAAAASSGLFWASAERMLERSSCLFWMFARAASASSGLF